MAALKNAKYEKTAKEYQDLFDTLLCRVDVSEDHAFSLYLGGLPTELEMNNSEDYEEKRAKNMCFYYDKKFVPGHKCEGKLFSLVGETFVTDVMLLPLGGCEIMLGIQWLATLGNIKCNFKELRMKFVHINKKLVLRVSNRHLLTQKNAIEARVKELCEAGVINQRHSPLPSFVVRVKMKTNLGHLKFDILDLASEEKEQSVTCVLWHEEMFTSYLSACSLGCTLDIH
ncbi:hypothetical protein Tco_0941812 [Tanacetum coccineum]|uniref:Uncharacterized protein n=1 Tax=Tanacetum coccineum TaxID=301880 RepID=A0ABQ5DSQ8_9ASTR